jgi:hypothetical protein
VTQILFIDEVSMVSAEFFTAVERGARAVRGNASPFGGVQLVRKMTQTLLRSLRAALTPHAPTHARTPGVLRRLLPAAANLKAPLPRPAQGRVSEPRLCVSVACVEQVRDAERHPHQRCGNACAAQRMQHVHLARPCGAF